ncbi:hypothetical protein EDB19DRAFT_1835748, partial [Suillus lakei]
MGCLNRATPPSSHSAGGRPSVPHLITACVLVTSNRAQYSFARKGPADFSVASASSSSEQSKPGLISLESLTMESLILLIPTLSNLAPKPAKASCQNRFKKAGSIENDPSSPLTHMKYSPIGLGTTGDLQLSQGGSLSDEGFKRDGEGGDLPHRRCAGLLTLWNPLRGDAYDIASLISTITASFHLIETHDPYSSDNAHSPKAEIETTSVGPVNGDGDSCVFWGESPMDRREGINCYGPSFLEVVKWLFMQRARHVDGEDVRNIV